MPTIRVYPQTGAMGGANRFGGAVSLRQHYSQQLNNQKQMSTLQLKYERALNNERIKNVRLQTRAQLNPFAFGGVGGYGNSGFGMPAAYANPYVGASMMGGQGGWGNAWGHNPIASMLGRWF